MNGMDDEQLEFMRNHPTKAIFDYQVSSAERYKHVNNEMFMNGSQDSDCHSPLMAYIRSKSATSKRSSERYQDYVKKKQSSWTTQEYKDYNKQWGHQNSGRTIALRPGMIMETIAVNPTAAADGIVDPTDHEDTFSTTNNPDD